MATTLRQAVYQTVCWFEIFKQPASSAEIHQFLFQHKAKLAEVEKILETDPRYRRSLKFYFRRQNPELIWQRFQHQFFARKLWSVVLRAKKIFARTPFLRQVFVANTLAFGWPSKDSDLDLFVLTSPQRLFTARFFLTVFTHFARRRRHGRFIAGRLCLSFFCASSQSDLSFLKIAPQDPYLAFWIANLIPVHGSGANDFFANNKWVKKVFPNLRNSYPVRPSLKVNFLEKLLTGPLGDLLENRLQKWQCRRASAHRKNHTKNAVVISDTCLKFHEIDRRKEFYQRWKKLCRANTRDCQ